MSLRLEVRLPELGEAGRQRRPVRHAGVPDAEGVQHRVQFLGSRPGERARSRAHQRQGHDIAAEGQAAAGPPCAGQDGLTGHQPAVGVPDQVPGAGRVDDRGDVRGERRRAVAVLMVRTGCLELPAHVDRDDLAASVGQQVEDGDEVFLAARIAGDEQGGVPLADPRGRRRLERRERAPAGVDRGAPYPVGQVKRGWCAHSGEPYLATLNKTSAVARETVSASREYADQEALRRLSWGWVSWGPLSAGRFSAEPSSRPALVRRRRVLLAAPPVPSPASRPAAEVFRA